VVLSETLVARAQKIADGTPRFFEIKGHGKGDNATNEFMKELKRHEKNSRDAIPIRPATNQALCPPEYTRF
jgi:hypothetical protein